MDRRTRAPFACAATLLAACLGPAPEGAPSGGPIAWLTGEVHLHDFPMGGHAWAAFLATPLPLAEVHGDQLVNLDPPPLRTEGPCSLYIWPTCTPACGEGRLCRKDNQCVPLSPQRNVDAGEVRVTGSRLWPAIRMWFTSAQSTYDADPAPGPTPLFAGGERLEVTGGQGNSNSDFAFSGAIPAPAPVLVTAPDLAGPLRLPAGAPLQVRWQPAGAQLMLLRLLAADAQGGIGYIRCLSADGGSLAVPADLLAGLPQPPRSLRFELERDEERFLPTVRPAVGILTHATFTAWSNTQE